MRLFDQWPSSLLTTFVDLKNQFMDEFMPGLPDVAPMPSSGDDRGSTVIWSMWMMVAVCFAFVAARIYTRTIILHNMGWDDYLLLCCWVNDLRSPST